MGERCWLRGLEITSWLLGNWYLAICGRGRGGVWDGSWECECGFCVLDVHGSVNVSVIAAHSIGGDGGGGGKAW